jgi:lipid A oxidase
VSTLVLTSLGVALLALVMVPGRAYAEWYAVAYLGGAHTKSNTLHLTDVNGSRITIGPVKYQSNSWQFPLYYGYRAGWSPPGSKLGFEGEWTHTKAISTTGSADLPHFELSHGLNTLLGNAVVRSGAFCGGRCALAGRVGFGITTPHVEAEFRGRGVNEYQFGGIAAQAGAGAEIRLRRRLYAVVDGRVTYARVEAELPGTHLQSGFTTLHVDVGLGWRFGR